MRTYKNGKKQSLLIVLPTSPQSDSVRLLSSQKLHCKDLLSIPPLLIHIPDGHDSAFCLFRLSILHNSYKCAPVSLLLWQVAQPKSNLGMLQITLLGHSPSLKIVRKELKVEIMEEDCSMACSGSCLAASFYAVQETVLSAVSWVLLIN